MPAVISGPPQVWEAVVLWDHFIEIPPIIRGKVTRRKSRVVLAPTTQHYYGTIAHKTIKGKGIVARLRR